MTSVRVCSLASIIKEYVPVLMKTFHKPLSEYNMQDATKCLNVAVLIMFLFLGERALNITRQCDVQNINTRFQNDPESVNSVASAKQLKRMLLRKSPSNSKQRYRELFYVMISNYENPKHFFTGHVFVIERVPINASKGPPARFYMYQAYLSKYTLDKFHEFNKQSFEISYEKMKHLAQGIIDFFQNDTWDDTDIQFWKDLTRVSDDDIFKLKGTVKKFNTHLCFKRVRLSTCARAFVNSLKKLLADPNSMQGISEADQKNLLKFATQLKDKSVLF